MENVSGAGGRRELAAAHDYANLLRRALKLSDEEALQVAYQFARDMLARGFGVLDFAVIHRYAMAEVMASRPSADPGHLTSLANRLLVEGLVPFEMVRRALPEANARLQASEARYRELVENASDMIFTLDLDGRLTSLNHAGQRLTGYTDVEARALAFDDLVAPEHARIAKALRRPRLGPSGTRARYTLDLLAKDGHRVPLEVSTRVLVESGRARGIQGIGRDMSDRLLAESALRHLNLRLEEKAKQIAHALHDEAGQLLASVYLKLAELERTPLKRGRQRFPELRAMLDEVDHEMRRLAYELRPAILDDLGLIPALEFLGEGVAKRNGFRVAVSGSTGGRLLTDVETAVYRVVQEALTNAARHGRPSVVTVELSRRTRTLSGRVVDDGSGFDMKATLGRTSASLGLVGMRERLAALGGSLTVTSTPGHGTTVQFEVPLEERDVHVSAARR
jgi:PAS domain S-box-containing protein